MKGMRRFVLTAVLVAGCSVFLYPDSPKFAVSLDFGPTLQSLINVGGLGIGASFEFAFLDQFSIVPQFSYSTYGSTEPVTQLTPGAQLRVYPISAAVNGFWAGAGYNYAIVTRTSGGTAVTIFVSAVIIDIGYKWIFGDRGLFIEPYGGYGLIFTDARTYGSWDYGFSAGFCF